MGPDGGPKGGPEGDLEGGPVGGRCFVTVAVNFWCQLIS